jgi:hypothetical protein
LSASGSDFKNCEWTANSWVYNPAVKNFFPAGEKISCIQILCRRTTNNPVIIGEPGVGKTAIAEG